MLFKPIQDETLAQTSYLIACPASGEAVVVDPRRDIGVYLEAAAREGLRVVAVTETHIHADFLSGARELAAATGARLLLSAEGGPDWRYAFPHEPLRDGDEIRVGNVILRAVHTPGHTPEHLSFLVTDGAVAGQPAILLSGDFVFVGDVGRPDLLDEAAGYSGTRFTGARQMYDSLRRSFLSLPDWVQVWPGHGAGSACGKALGAVPSSTVGYERRFAWWAGHLEAGDEAGFTAALLDGQPDAPAYFARMKRDNRQGPALLGARPPLPALDAGEARRALDAGAWLVDTRSREAFQAGSLPGAVHLPAGRNFPTWAGWLLDPAREVILQAPDAASAEARRDELARTGLDRVIGFVPSLDGLERQASAPLAPAELDALNDPFLLDVRTAAEHQAGHIPGCARIHAGRLMGRLGELPRDRPVVVTCQGGSRSAAVASALRAAGLNNILDLAGGFDAWDAWRRAGVEAAA